MTLWIKGGDQLVNRALAAIVLSTLFGCVSAIAAPVDLREGSAFCAASAKKFAALKAFFKPAWVEENLAKSPVHTVYDPVVAAADALAHNLNSHYLRNMTDSTYVRLAAAKTMGFDLGKYREGFARVARFCAAPDRSGQTLGMEASRLVRIPDEVEADFAAFSLTPNAENYLRRLTVAALEAQRLDDLIQGLQTSIAFASPDSSQVAYQRVVLFAHLRRLVRLQFHYPVLVAVGTFSGGTRLQLEVENAMLPKTGMAPNAIYFTDPRIEEKLGLNPSGIAAADLPAAPSGEDPNIVSGGEHFYLELYDAILSGRRPLPTYLRQRLLQAIDLSVREGIASAMLKCQNSSPCAAVSVSPDLAASELEPMVDGQNVGAALCACQVGGQHEWIDGKINLGLGFVSAAAVVTASVYPVDWLVILAYGLAGADSLSAAAGMGDSYFNVNRTNMVALRRAGGVVAPVQELETLSEYSHQRYNAIYNLITGAIGIAPPGRILARSSSVSVLEKIRTPEFIAQAKLEFSKGASGAPAPEGPDRHYELSFDPREYSGPAPFELRQRFPEVAALIDFTARKFTGTDLDVRDAVFAKIKTAARNLQYSELSEMP